MPREVLLPEVAVDFESGSIEQWLKHVGDDVAVGDVLAEVSTDKAVVEIEAETAGRIGKILVDAGATDVNVNTPIAIMLLDGEDESSLDGWSSSQGASGSSSKAAGTANEKPDDQPNSETVATVRDIATPTRRSKRLAVSPIARRIAAKQGIDLHDIQGSGPEGRIVLGDIEAVMAQSDNDDRSTASEPETKGQAPAAFTRRPADKIWKIAAKRLTDAKRDIPHFYLTVDCELDRLMDARRQLNEDSQPNNKLSVNDFFLKACASALRAVPNANVAWDDDAILQFNNVDIAIAVSSPKGLMTPVLRNTDTKDLDQISVEARDLADRARAGTLKLDELKGGSFTISNLGMFGIRDFSAIINPPQACILAVGTGEQRAVVRDGALAIATVATCTLSVDHRAVDGALSAELLNAVKGYIENPMRLTR